MPNGSMPLKKVVIVAPDRATAEGFKGFLTRVSLVMNAVNEFAATIAGIDARKPTANDEGTKAVDRFLKAVLAAYPGELGGDQMSADGLSLELISSMMPKTTADFLTGANRKEGH
jgi:hypothetical protein